MSNGFIKIGYSNFVNLDRVIAVVSPDSAPVRRMIQDARDRGALIDASSGKKTRAVMVMDSEQLILSALAPEGLVEQFSNDDSRQNDEDVSK